MAGITLSEDLLTLSQAAASLPGMTGRGLHAATVWRWAQRGIGGIRLETILVGGIRYTSREALERFVAATTAAADGTTKVMMPTTPRLFTPAALDFAHDPDAKAPAAWLEFLRQLWGDDADSILTLQQWFGLCLAPDTRFQKMLLIVGPKRSGKGTIARVLRAVVGEWNCAGPTMASLATNFGLWPLWGKTVAIICDARLSGRTDSAVITERLLSITGEDALTIDRKHQEPVTTKLLTRLLILTNELPRLGDYSGALSGRMLILRLIRSFCGQEEIGLTDRLLQERAGILAWAIEGWKGLRDQGYFIQPESSNDLREQLDEMASPVTAFVDERCTTDGTFGRDLTAAFPHIRRQRPRENGSRVWTYFGIGLHHQSAEEFT